MTDETEVLDPDVIETLRSLETDDSPGLFAELVERCTTPVEIALVHEDQRLLPLHGAVQLSHAICGEEVPGPARTVQV